MISPTHFILEGKKQKEKRMTIAKKSCYLLELKINFVFIKQINDINSNVIFE